MYKCSGFGNCTPHNYWHYILTHKHMYIGLNIVRDAKKTLFTIFIYFISIFVHLVCMSMRLFVCLLDIKLPTLYLTRQCTFLKTSKTLLNIYCHFFFSFINKTKKISNHYHHYYKQLFLLTIFHLLAVWTSNNIEI